MISLALFLSLNTKWNSLVLSPSSLSAVISNAPTATLTIFHFVKVTLLLNCITWPAWTGLINFIVSICVSEGFCSSENLLAFKNAASMALLSKTPPKTLPSQFLSCSCKITLCRVIVSDIVDTPSPLCNLSFWYSCWISADSLLLGGCLNWLLPSPTMYSFSLLPRTCLPIAEFTSDS